MIAGNNDSVKWTKYLCCDHKTAECPKNCIHASFHSVRQCHGLCPIDKKRQQCSPDEFTKARKCPVCGGALIPDSEYPEDLLCEKCNKAFDANTLDLIEDFSEEEEIGDLPEPAGPGAISMTSQNGGSLELGEKPKESSLFPKPWMESTTEIVSPILWLGKLTRGQADLLGMVIWFSPLVLLIYIHLKESDQVLGAVVLTWIAAALYASWIVQRINFDIKEGS